MARHVPVTILLSAAAMVLLAAALALLSPETALVGVASLVCIQALLMTRSAYALLPLLAIAVAYHAFSSVPLGLGSIAVYPTDMALVGALLLWLIFYSLRGQPLFIPKGHQYVLLLCVVLVEPIAIGLIQGAALQSVLAPARVLAYYASFLVFVSHQGPSRSIKRPCYGARPIMRGRALSPLHASQRDRLGERDE